MPPSPPDGVQDISLDLFGGLVTDMSASTMPDGASPDCQDCAFNVGAVKQRPGLLSLLTAAIAGNPTVNYLKSFHLPNLTAVLLALDSQGALWSETGGARTQINTGAGTFIVPGARGQSTTLFGREYLALSDGKFGLDIPRQYDGTNFDRVSQCAPGAPPVVGDASTGTGTIGASATGLVPHTDTAAGAGWYSDSAGTLHYGLALGLPAGLIFGADKVKISGSTGGDYDGTFTVAGVDGAGLLLLSPPVAPGLIIGDPGTIQFDLVTVTTTTAIVETLGGIATIAGAGISGYDGAWTVRAVVSGTVTVLAVTGAQGLAASGGGTITASGSITAGLHQVRVSFVTRQGYITKPSPPASWNAAGNLAAQLTNIPLPAPDGNVVGRIVMFTAAAGADFYYTAAMMIPDVTTTTLLVNFTDADLLASSPAAELLNLVELGECAGVTSYAERLFWIGERNKINNLVNLTFDGGFYDATPLGWTTDPTNGAGGAGLASALWGGAYQITGDGNAADQGMITQPAYQDALSVPILNAATPYSARIRLMLKPAAAATSGNVVVELYSPSLGSLGTFTTSYAALTSTFQEFIGTIWAGASVVPTDVLLRVYATGLNNGGGIIADNIQLFPTATPYLNGQARVSLAGDPESYDGVTGLIGVSDGDGSSLRAAFVLTDRSQLVASDHLYLVKENSIYHTQDSGGEPASWSLTQISGSVGTPSVNGCDIGEDWAAIAHSSGLYLHYFGIEPTKVSQEIQATWDRINWAYGHTLWVRVDIKNKLILVGAPLDGATSPNYVLAMDYRGLVDSTQIVTTPPVHFSSYSGKMISMGLGRKWCIWTIAAASAWFEPAASVLTPGAGACLIGNGAGTGKIYALSYTQVTDDGAAIPFYYITYFFPSRIQEQSLQLRSHRKLFSFLALFVEGAGNLLLTAYPDSLSNPVALPSLALSSPALRDTELPTNILGERVAYKVSVDGVAGSWVRLEILIPQIAPDPWSPVRGVN